MCGSAGELLNTPTLRPRPTPITPDAPGVGSRPPTTMDSKALPSWRSTGLRLVTSQERSWGAWVLLLSGDALRWGLFQLCFPVRCGHSLGCIIKSCPFRVSGPLRPTSLPSSTIRPSSCVACTVRRPSNYFPPSATGLSQGLVQTAAPVIGLKNRSRHAFL